MSRHPCSVAYRRAYEGAGRTPLDRQSFTDGWNAAIDYRQARHDHNDAIKGAWSRTLALMLFLTGTPFALSALVYPDLGPSGFFGQGWMLALYIFGMVLAVLLWIRGNRLDAAAQRDFDEKWGTPCS